MTTGELASLPKGMCVMGWVLASLMMLYPVDTILAARAIRQIVAAERAEQQASPPTSGMHFDLRTPATHCGPLGWAGAWGFILGVVWMCVAGALWLYYRLTGRMLAKRSRRAFIIVTCGVAIVFGSLLAESRLYGL